MGTSLVGDLSQAPGRGESSILDKGFPSTCTCWMVRWSWVPDCCLLERPLEAGGGSCRKLCWVGGWWEGKGRCSLWLHLIFLTRYPVWLTNPLGSLTSQTSWGNSTGSKPSGSKATSSQPARSP